MQKLKFFPPEPNPRSVQPQPLQTVLVPGKRKPFIKQVLPPIPPRIDNRVWYSTAQVIRAIAENRLHPSLVARTLAEVRAFELHFSRGEKRELGLPVTVQFPSHDALNGEFSQGFYRGKPKDIPSLSARAIYLRAKLKQR